MIKLEKIYINIVYFCLEENILFITGGYNDGDFLWDSEVVSTSANCSKPSNFPNGVSSVQAARVDGAPVVCGVSTASAFYQYLDLTKTFPINL